MWNTVGGLREEKIEAFHNIGKNSFLIFLMVYNTLSNFFSVDIANIILQILCCVRQKDLRLVQMMERSELKQGLVKQFAIPVPRNFLCPSCKKTGRVNVKLVEKRCPECGYQKD